MDTQTIQPRIELLRTDRIVLFCALCGDVGPQPVQAVVMTGDVRASEVVGHACGNCLALNSFDLADAIEEHVEFLRGLAHDAARVQGLAKAGRLQRPSVAKWREANDREMGEG